MTTVAIVDDHSVVRIGIKYVLMTDSEFKFVGEADDGAEAVSLVEKVHPDILLLDVRMPGTGGIAALKSVREKFPDQKVVMLTMSDAEEDVYQANLPLETPLHLRLARAAGLAVTAGSDFHGMNKSSVTLGMDVGDEEVFIAPLLAALAKRGSHFVQ